MVAIPDPTPEVYAEFQAAYDYFNECLFDNELPPCLITLQREKRTMGYFSHSRFIRRTGEMTDEIALNPAFFAVLTVEQILSVLVHEMVHAWQYFCGEPGRGRYHNKEFALKMESIGLMTSSTGRPGGARTGDCMDDYVISGGLFEECAAEYMESFNIASWLDRFPAFVPPPAAQMSEEDKEGYSEEELAEIQAESERIVQERGKLERMGVAFALHAKKATNRHKYQCPSCLRQVWGKPGLLVHCGHCEGLPLMTPVAEMPRLPKRLKGMNLG